MISHSCVVANRLKRRSLNRTNRRRSLSPGKKKNNIVVAVRVRPESKKEQGSPLKVLQVVDQNVLLFDPMEDEEDKFFYQGVRQNTRDLLKKPHKNLPFTFDYVFDGSASNEDVFNLTTSLIIDRVLSGFNSSVFAYGATGAGKTYTMIGTPESPGIIFLMVMALFRQIELLQDKVCDVSISYMEVYNETIKDLLTPSPPLSIREDTKGIVVSGLSHFKPHNAEHLMQMLHFGNKNRTQHPTDANSESSRSHAVFQVYVRQKDKVSGLSANVRVAKMTLIDLAGSERATVVSTREKARLREGASINQSLLALGSCINALADRKNKAHIPYRNSKLTRILKDSLGGNCFTVMIAAVSPSLMSYEDTYNTLKYADRAKGIKVALKHNVVNVDAHISKYVKIVEAHQSEIAELKAKLESYEKIYASHSLSSKVETFSSATMTSPQTFGASVVPEKPNLSVDVYMLLLEENQKLREKYLDCESTLRLLKAKKNWKQDIQQLHGILSGEHRAATNMDTLTKTMDLKEKRLLNERSKLSSLLVDSQNKLDQCKQQMGDVVSERVANKELSLNNVEAAMQMKHFLSVASLKAKYEETYRSVLESLSTVVRRQQYILKGRGVLSSDLVTDLDAIISQLHGVKEVNWADQSSPRNKLHPDVPELYRLVSESNQQSETPVLPLGRTQQQNTCEIINRPVCPSVMQVSPVNGEGDHFGVKPCDAIRRSLDETFAVMAAANSPVPSFSQVALNRTFSPVEPAISTPVSSLLNRTFTPVNEKNFVDGGIGKMGSNTYADILKSQAPSEFLVPSSYMANPTRKILSLASPELPTNVDLGVKPLEMSKKELTKAPIFTFPLAKNEPEGIAFPKDVPAGATESPPKTTNPFKILHNRTIEKNKISKPSWARPFKINLKAKENCEGVKHRQTLTKQTSFLPRPGSLHNKRKLSMSRCRSTPLLNKFNPDFM